MNIGDLVVVVSSNNPFFGEVGIITKRLNDFFVKVMIPSGEYIYSPEALEAIA